MLFNSYNLYAKIIVFLGAIFAVALIVIFTGNNYDGKILEIDDNNIHRPNMFEGISLEAKTAFVWDVNDKNALYALNEEAQLPLASLTKLMTAITAIDILPESAVITIDNKSLVKEGDSGLYANEKWSFKDLISFTLVVSSNDGANALANVAGLLKNGFPSREEDNEKTFVKKMNEKAKELGLNQTYFINPTGLDANKDIGGGYGSARDAAKLMEHIIINAPDIVEDTRRGEIRFVSLSKIGHTATNTNLSADSIPGLIASKTGYTNLADGNLVIAFDAGFNRPIIISVLGSTAEGRFRDIEKLVKASLESL